MWLEIKIKSVNFFFFFKKICLLILFFIKWILLLPYNIFLSIKEKRENKKLLSLIKHKKNPRQLSLDLSSFPDKFFIFIKKFKPGLNKKFIMPTIFFILLLFVLISPFKIFNEAKNLLSLKKNLSLSSEQALNNLINAKDSLEAKNFLESAKDFSNAGSNFVKAGEDLKDVNELLLLIAKTIPNKEAKLAANSKKIIAAGTLASDLGVKMSLTLNNLLNKTNQKTLDKLEIFTKDGKENLKILKELNNNIESIDIDSLPEEYKEQFLFLKNRSLFLEKNYESILGLANDLKNFLGDKYDKRYLLVFQNNKEMRASGGFMGSFAIVDFSKGEIKKIETPKGGTYDVEAGRKRLIVSPYPLHIVNPLWNFWDSNWWPDWPTSAKKIAWFYENNGGSSVDGVISFTPTFMEDLLRVVGPIDMTKKYGQVITSENFWLTVQEIAEQKPDVTKEPKKIIGDMFDEIIKKMGTELDKDKILKLAEVSDKNFKEKNILLYFYDKNLEKRADDFGWSGRLKNFNGDYLMVVNTNISGGKSDHNINQEIKLTTNLNSNGEIINELTIDRKHTGQRGDVFSGVRNNDWMRIYVPLGSKLIEASGFKTIEEKYFEEPDPSWEKDDDLKNENNALIDLATNTKIYEENKKTVFANWSITEPNETSVIKIKYKLPFKLANKKNQNFFEKIKNLFSSSMENYSLLVQKQPGQENSKILAELNNSYNKKIITNYPEKITLSNLDSDKYFVYLFDND